jgi:serine/threonine protein kinase
MTMQPGHKNCLKRGVLHRDISPSNVMIDVKTREGFIIDLDLALQWPESVDHHWTLTVRPWCFQAELHG